MVLECEDPGAARNGTEQSRCEAHEDCAIQVDVDGSGAMEDIVRLGFVEGGLVSGVSIRLRPNCTRLVEHGQISQKEAYSRLVEVASSCSSPATLDERW